MRWRMRPTIGSSACSPRSDAEVEEPTPDQIYQVGTAALVHRMLRAPDGTIRLIVQGLERIRIDSIFQQEPYLRADIAVVPDDEAESLEQEALMRTTQELFRRLVALVPHMPEELETAAINATSARQLAYLVAASIRMEPAQAQEILEIDPVSEKLVRLNSLLTKELEVLELGRKIQTQAQDEMTKMQREYFLREQLKAIQKELGEATSRRPRSRSSSAASRRPACREEAEKEARRELDRMRKMPTQAAEYTVIKTYLDWMVSLPWQSDHRGQPGHRARPPGAGRGPLRPGGDQGAHPGVPGRAQAAHGAPGGRRRRR